VTSTGPTVDLKETCRVVRGTVPLWPYHRARLSGGGVPEAVLDALEDSMADAAVEWADSATRRARLTAVVHPDGTFEVVVAQRLSSLDVVGGLAAMRIHVSDAPQLPEPPAKPADRSFWDEAHRAAQARGGHQAVLVDENELVVDGSTAAVWIAEHGELITPPSPPAIPSVSRAYILDRAASADLRVRVEPFSWQRFKAADEAFFTNAFGGVAPVRGRGGALYSAVKRLFDHEVW